mgnify:CR=1 FL=1
MKYTFNTPVFNFYCNTCIDKYGSINDNESQILDFADTKFVACMYSDQNCDNCLQKIHKLVGDNYLLKQVNNRTFLVQNINWFENHKIFSVDFELGWKKLLEIGKIIIKNVFEHQIITKKVKCNSWGPIDQESSFYNIKKVAYKTSDINKLLETLTIGTILISNDFNKYASLEEILREKLLEVSGCLELLYNYHVEYRKERVVQHFAYRVVSTCINVKPAIK